MARIPHRIYDQATGQVRAIKVGEQPCNRESCQFYSKAGCHKRHYAGQIPEGAGTQACAGYLRTPPAQRSLKGRPRPKKVKDGQQVKLG